ncbi:MAG: glycosyltransferase family 4 protein [Bacteroidales bacterium]|nr:glycosyltransferase family 4 protein [Bacteroidales bacterium]
MKNSAKPTILFIEPWLPYPLRSGGHQAIYNGLLAVKDDYNIIITYQESYESSNVENKKILVETLGSSTLILPYKLPQPFPQKPTLRSQVINLLRRLFPQSKSVDKSVTMNSRCVAWTSQIQMIPMAYVNHVLSIINRYKVDIVQCEMIMNAAFVYYLPDTIKKIFVHHEISFVRQTLESQTIVGDEVEKKACLKFARAKEIGTLNLYDAIITLSQVDKDKLEQVGVNTKIFTSFAIVNMKRQICLSSNINNRLSFVGPSTNPPNIEAVRWFLDNCWNSLLLKGNYQLQIVGHWDDRLQQKIMTQYRDVSFTGFVDDLSKVLKDTIMIVPITIGSGIRMKMLEAASIGIPIVSTSVGVEGLPFINNEHCLISDNPNGFIDAIIQLNDNALCSNLVINARKKVEECFTIEALKRNRCNIYSQLLI